MMSNKKGGLINMVSWKNFDTLASYEKLMALKGRVDLVEVMSGESGAKHSSRRNMRSCTTVP